MRDLASRYQLVWQPLPEATAEIVQSTYARLFAEQGAPLVMKSDNGGQFQAEETKQLLAAHGVTDLDVYSVVPGTKNFLPDFFLD